MNKTLTLPLSAALLTVLPAQAQSPQTIFINGVALEATTTTKNGATYYQFKASDLKRIGALTAGGVVPRIEAVKGCIGDTLFNGVYTVQLIKAGNEDSAFGVTLKLSNASNGKLYNFMAFSPSNVVAATSSSAVPLNNYVGKWIDTLLPGTAVTLHTRTDNQGAVTKWTRLLIRPDADAVKKMQQAKLPLAKIYNMEFDLACKK